MKKAIKFLCAWGLATATFGCCISSRCWRVDEEIVGHELPASGSYHVYTNGVGGKVYKYCSNANGPWKGSDVYPATRFCLNALTFFSYSSVASGDYMLNIVVLPLYPVFVIATPIQFCLDTIFLPWDVYAAPTTPGGYWKVK